MSELTQKQKDVLAFIREYLAAHHRPPTTREIQVGLQIRNIGTVQAFLFALLKKSKIRIEPGIARGIEIIEEAPTGAAA